MAGDYKRYVPQTVGELMDLLGAMMLTSPTFKDDTGFFFERDINTTFEALYSSLEGLRRKLGEERYAKLVDLAQRMRTLFEADPEDKTGETIKGRQLIVEMEKVLRRKTL